MQDSWADKFKREFTFDLPINLYDIDFYPVMMSDYYDFMFCHYVLKIKKNELNPAFISMSYLDFLIEMMKEDTDIGKMYKMMIARCFYLITKMDSFITFGKDDKGKSYIEIGGIYLNSKQFDDVRKAVLYQNFPDYEDDSNIDPQLAHDLQEVARLRNKNRKMVSLEKQIISIMTNTSMPLDKIFAMSIRKFILTLEMVDKKMHYIIYKTASMSGMVKFDKEIEHYMFETSNGFEDKVIEADTIINKIKSTNL